MRLYFSHSSQFDFQKELYEPLKTSPLVKEHELLFTGEVAGGMKNNRAAIKTLDIFFAEVSEPSLGVGIELGWAADTYLPIVCLHKKGAVVSPVLRQISQFFIEYSDPADLVKKVREFIGRIEFEE